MANAIRCKRMMKVLRMKMRTGDEVGSSAMPVNNMKSSEEGTPVSHANPSMFLSDSSRALNKVRDLMCKAIQMKKTEMPDVTVNQLREEYLKLDWVNRQKALVVLATQFGVDRKRVGDLISSYRSLNFGDKGEQHEGADAACYRMDRELRLALIPLSARLFEQMNGLAGGLKFLVDLRKDLMATIQEQNLASLRALDSELKEMFSTWLGPACLELRQITWDNSAALLERIVVHEAVHPITNLYDLKRRLGVGRRCYGYFHPTIPGEPLVFIEVALTKDLVGSIQEVLFEEPPISENEATTALFYSISSTQTGLAGIDLGNFLIKRVVRLLQKEIANIETFVTLSPIPGFMKWLIPKLEAQLMYFMPQQTEDHGISAMSNFKEKLLLPEEECALLEISMESIEEKNAVKILCKHLKSSGHEWTKSEKLMAIFHAPLMRLCTRYLLQEKKRGRALDPVTNFHVRNGASVERINWMGDTSAKGFASSAGIMVNYIYRLDKIEANNEAYLSKGTIAVSADVEKYLKSHPSSEGE